MRREEKRKEERIIKGMKQEQRKKNWKERKTKPFQLKSNVQNENGRKK